MILGQHGALSPVLERDPCRSRRARGLRAAAATLGLIALGAPPAVANEPGAAVEPVRVCLPSTTGDACNYGSIADAFREVLEGETIVIAPGDYEEAAVLTVSGITIRGEAGAHITGAAAEGKAALVIRADDTTIEGIECSAIAVPDRNGACIRLEGQNLTLRNVHFHDSQQGLLSGGNGGDILIEDSTFERLGYGGQAHAIYVNGDALTIRGSRVLSTTGEGHGVKSLTAKTTIEDSTIASLDGADSRLIDAAYGGEVVVRNNVLQEGPNSTNGQLIAVGLEGLNYPTNAAVIEDNIVLMERELHANSMRDKLRRVAEAIGLVGPAIAWTELIRVPSAMPPPTIRGNVIVGGFPYENGDNRWFNTREEAGLPAAPELPVPQ